jgi:hypothetical protein
MKTALILLASVAFVAAIENPAHACTASQTASYNLAVRAMHMAADISKTAGGQRADDAVHALMDLVDSINKTLPVSCGQDA